MSESVVTRVIDIIANVTGVGSEELTNDSGPDTVGLWDSFAELNIMVALEDEFGLQLNPEDVAEMATVGHIAAFVERRTS